VFSLEQILDQPTDDLSETVLILRGVQEFLRIPRFRIVLFSSSEVKARWAARLRKYLVSTQWELRDSSLEVITGILERIGETDLEFLNEEGLFSEAVTKNQDPEPFVRATFLRMLRLLHSAQQQERVLFSRVMTQEAVWSLVQERLQDSEAIVRRAAVEVLEVLLMAGQESPEAVEMTFSESFTRHLLDDPDWEVRVRVVRCLALLASHHPAAFHQAKAGFLLFQLLDESEHQVVLSALDALEVIKAGREIPEKQISDFRARLESTDLRKLRAAHMLATEEELPQRADFDDIFSHIHVCDNTLDCY